MKNPLLKTKLLLATTATFLISCAETPKDDAPWVDLFDGETLNGWHKLGGDATYAVKEGTIVGTTTHNTPNTFLTI